jgi:hypothetical protein
MKEKQLAVSSEDYELAARIKQKIDSVTAIQSQIDQLTQEKDRAV